MNVLVVFAHPEPEKSFNKALLDTSISTLQSEGHEIKVSDLYKMNFNSVASAEDFKNRRFPDRLQYDREQKYAVANGGLADDIQEELDKVFWADVLIFQFPLYWFSMPAIMKGWFDRVFVNSLVYGAGKRFEKGGLSGRKAMICVSTGGYEQMFQPDGLLGDVDAIFHPIHHGIFAYSGLETLPPFVAWAPVYHKDDCDKYLSAYSERMKNLETEQVLPGHVEADFDENFRMKPSVKPKTLAHIARR